jgi:hypothetical protein
LESALGASPRGFESPILRQDLHFGAIESQNDSLRKCVKQKAGFPEFLALV